MFNWEIITQEATNGNYSFFILVAAVVQIFIMIIVGMKKK